VFSTLPSKNLKRDILEETIKLSQYYKQLEIDNNTISSELNQIISQQFEKQLESNKEYTPTQRALQKINFAKETLQTLDQNLNELEEISINTSKEAEMIKIQYFFTLAVTLKLTRQLRGKNINVNINNLYQTAKDIPFIEWDTWLNDQMDKK